MFSRSIARGPAGFWGNDRPHAQVSRAIRDCPPNRSPHRQRRSGFALGFSAMRETAKRRGTAGLVATCAGAGDGGEDDV